MNAAFVNLSRALPSADGAAVRLRRWAGRTVSRGAQPNFFAFRTDLTPSAPIAPDALLAIVCTSVGEFDLALEPRQWPDLALAAGLPDAGRRSAVAMLLLSECIGASAAELLSVDLRTTAPPGSRSIGVELSRGDSRAQLLRMDEALFRSLERSLDKTPPRLAQGALRMRLPSRVVLASRGLSNQVLQRLRQRDVLLLPDVPARPGAGAAGMPMVNACLAWGPGSRGALRVPVLLQDTKMTLTSPLDLAMPDMAPVPSTNSHHGHAGDAGISDALARMELPVQFEMAGPSLQLADIASLVADDVLELPMAVEQSRVRMVVAGQCVGLGELVAVGNRLGVRILRMDLASEMPGAGS
ncbi:FliM/FliN family flagellar motor switch protein [Xylophilus sp. GOD-11R]|uniref:FliM/FliN family flagellar motor switch protein n=1 Tax=Xylophilus sp. GOD-11R TaxID=3089814 RepID=UPI00298C6FFA|nr:FliM/FliN family flagellar motor switch protein [Xylophilus sp. GOD-11R]WPB57930.1 FliM/FliN family flagellar motor switch protein [Xylophilus sp. GOD-11R]